MSILTTVANVGRGIAASMRKLGVYKRSAHKPHISLSTIKGDWGVEGFDQRLAEEFADDLKAMIERQIITWVPLNKKYARRKRLLGQDPRILMATGRYVRAIHAEKQADGSWQVAVPNTPLKVGSKHTLQDLAKWLEFGTKTMPARPHWRPITSLWKTKMYQVKQRMRFDLAKEFKKMGFE